MITTAKSMNRKIKTAKTNDEIQQILDNIDWDRVDILEESVMALFVEGLVQSCSDFGQGLRHNLDQFIELSGEQIAPEKIGPWRPSHSCRGAR